MFTSSYKPIGLGKGIPDMVDTSLWIGFSDRPITSNHAREATPDFPSIKSEAQLRHKNKGGCSSAHKELCYHSGFGNKNSTVSGQEYSAKHTTL